MLSRVHFTGGASSFSIGDASVTPVKAQPAPVVATPVSSTPAPAAASSPIPATPVTVFSSVDMPVDGDRRVGVVIGGMFANELLQNAVLLALRRVGITNVVLRMTKDAVVLPYVCKSLMGDKCDVVFAGCVLDGDRSDSAQTAGLLLQSLTHAGIAGSVPVVPGVSIQSDLLAAKVVLPELATQWAAAVGDLLQLSENPRVFNQEVVMPAEPEKPYVPVLTAETSAATELMAILRESFKAHGVTGIFSMGRKFRIIDDDGNGTIEFSEFKKCIAEHALDWSDAQLKAVFDNFDTDKSGSISFDEFLKGCRDPMNSRRQQMTLMAFAIMDADKSGVIEMNDIQGKYNADKHPDVISGKRTTTEVLREFLDTFDSAEKDGKITPAEFLEYYSNVSASIDNDDYFELMMRNAWHISGGEGQCANSSCRRVLVTHTDGHQSVEEIKNDLGVDATDKDAMIANLVAQGIATVASIDLTGSADNTTPPANAAAVPAAAAPASPDKKSAGTDSKSTAPNPVVANSRGRFGRGSGQALGSSITF